MKQMIEMEGRIVNRMTKKLLLLAAACTLLIPFGAAKAQKPIPPGMVMIPAGNFIMGFNDGDKRNGPQRTVYLDEYAIDKYEVTNEDFKKYLELRSQKNPKANLYPVCRSMERDKPAPQAWKSRTQIEPGKEKYPVVCVPQTMARLYCQTYGKKLPTEAEWEKAARGADGRAYPWGNEWDTKKTNHGLGKAPWEDPSDGFARIAPVGSFPGDVSPYGVNDMAGNAWEWTADFYIEAYNSATPKKNPPPVKLEQLSENERATRFIAVRGGSWALDQNGTKVFKRNFRPANQYDDSGGFRCAADLK